ncbi:RidA family protein [Streptomyces sp. 7N604]|uniref:RidA family protein n=1 Tax=Streptomyces sp. 7N604 TaxID=3457415 RepID=UPI003FD1939F
MTRSPDPIGPAPGPVVERGRIVRDVVDGPCAYFSRLATAGPYTFLSGLAVDNSGNKPDGIDVLPPYYLSRPEQARSETEFFYKRYVERLPELHSSIGDVVQIETWVPEKKLGPAFLETTRGPGFHDVPEERPTSALISTGNLVHDFASVVHTGIAVSPRYGTSKQVVPASEGYHESFKDKNYGSSFTGGAPFNEAITGGGMVFTVGDTAVDWATRDIHPKAKVDPFVAWGSEIASETEFVLTRLEQYLSRVGATLDDVVHMTVYLTHFEDLAELDRVWRKRFATDPPARTVIPCSGLLIPAYEGTDLHHRDRAVRMEQIAQSINPGGGYTKQIVSTGARPLGHESEAIKAGPLLWTSNVVAGDASGLHTAPDIASQLDYLFTRLDAICQAGGTSLSNLVRLRAFVTEPVDGYAVYTMLRKAVPEDPPTVAVTAVPGPLHVPGARVALDAVAYVP